MGLFAHLLGIRPWEIAELTVDEFTLLAHWIDKYNETQKSGG